ncbi:CDP-alcohol phosphatidyltransferase family protein [Devosia sp. FKR38]|uniref:CDP-alcohol phosphatidyltransferase family protein n=1 Tax=Devosia sp. FKR38 TaxID=2562312 RepID=UPI0010C0B49B|nr:CDP-alcohol phosphatidyltransferase family protein [Devosia sp. FKR38]
MLDSYLIPTQERLLRPFAARLLALGATANGITIAGFLVGLAAVPAIAFGQFPLGLALIALNRLLDGLDGAVARLAGPTDRGAFLDIALDFFFYAAIPFAFVLADPAANGLAGSLLLLSFVGTGSSFLAFAVIAQRRGLSSLKMPKKGLYYLGGITEGAETIALFVLICLFPTLFPFIATAFAALALVTTLVRWWWGWKAFAE